MASRQRSFFDQDRKKARTNFNRARSVNDAYSKPMTTGPSKPAGNAMPIAPASQTKRKLKNFQFIPGGPAGEAGLPEDADKENMNPSDDPPKRGKVDYTKRTRLDEPVEHPVDRQPAAVTRISSQPNNALFPSTPVPRLPLSDLVGQDGDDDLTEDRDDSPEEHVQWKHHTPARSRGKKRARSSSPLSSHLDTIQEHSSFDMQRLSHTLKTPQADPAADLLSRYGINLESMVTPDTAGNVAHAEAPHPGSSPRSSSQGGNVNGLRRWLSCGNQFPESRSPKRRRVADPSRDVLDRLVESPSRAALAHVEMHRNQRQKTEIETLIGKITDLSNVRYELQKPPSSSGPLPETRVPEVEAEHGNRISNTAPEPARTKDRCPFSSQETLAGEADPAPQLFDGPNPPLPKNVQMTPVRRNSPKQPTSSSTDYGSLDLDSDDYDILDAITAHSTQAAIAGSRSQLSTAPAGSQTNSRMNTAAVKSASPPLANGEPTRTDDDYDFDDDLDLDDLVPVADFVQTKPFLQTQQPLPLPTVQVQTVYQETRAAKPNTLNEDEYGDFDDVDFDDLVPLDQVDVQGASAKNQQPAAGSVASSQNEGIIQRYRISSVVESTYENRLAQVCPEKVLVVTDDKTKKNHVIRLQQSWYDSTVSINSHVSLIGDFDNDNTCIVDNAENLLILHPDYLVSTTHVADAFSCLRRAVLQSRVRSTNLTNQYIMYGHMIHELLQRSLEENKWDTEWLSACVELMLPRYLEDIAEINLSLEQVREHLRNKYPELQTWAAKFVGNWQKPISSVGDRGGKKIPLAITKLLDVEEHIWSPKYGLKGNVDATVEAFMDDYEGQRRLVAPLELKTGRKYGHHRAQTALYTLLLSDRYDVDTKYGLLYYLEDSEMMRIPALRHELIHMIIKRNEIACYVSEKTSLPPMLNHNRMCDNCYTRSSCFAYHRLLEDGAGETLEPKAKAAFDKFIRYLTPKHAEFFKKWDDLLTKEEKDSFQARELWTMTSKEREKIGRCYAHVTIQPGSFQALSDVSKINRYEYTLLRPDAKPSASQSSETELAVAEPIVISDEKGHFYLAKGFVKHADKRKITVLLDRRLHNARVKQPGFDPDRNQSFSAFMDVSKSKSQLNDSATQGKGEPVLYRLDKDEYATGMATLRNNIVQIMDDAVFKASDLRSLIIDLRAPTFKPHSSHVITSTQGASMNVDQIAAIEKVMSAQEYALVLGMPGTGKTTTIAYIIKALVAKGKSVLLTSYTHTAVDNILLKIRDGGFKILRVGVKAKIHHQVQQFAILADEQKASLEELQDSWHSPPVVAATALSVNSRLFNQRTFDYCIVDEASQITLPACVGPIRMAKTFILVGDHHQLPPLVKNRKAADGGLDVSLFKHLCEAHPQATVCLEHQYRMCAEIMSLPNKLIYSGRLKCGNDATTNLSLRIPFPEVLSRYHFPDTPSHSGQPLATNPSPPWLCPGTNPRTCHLVRLFQPSTKVLFLNTDPLGPTALELPTTGDRRQNPFEARLCSQIISSLLDGGVPPSEIGLVTFYRAQLALLRSTFKGTSSALEMSTADKFQGRDKDVVIVSFVRSNENGHVGELLLDKRRVNVAITRAKSKLVLVGSKKTLLSAKRRAPVEQDDGMRVERNDGSELLRDLVRQCEANGWVFDLHPQAIDAHSYLPPGSASTSTPGESPERSRHSSAPRRMPGGAAGSSQRRPLGVAGGNMNGAPIRRHGALKGAEKVGVVDQDVLLKSRPLARDIFNEMNGF